MKLAFFHFAYPLGIYNTTKLDWKRSSGKLEFWKGLLFATDVSTTERKPSSESSTFWLWRWLPRRLSKREWPTAVPLRTLVTQTIFFNKGMLLLSSNHFHIIRQANEFSLHLLQLAFKGALLDERTSFLSLSKLLHCPDLRGLNGPQLRWRTATIRFVRDLDFSALDIITTEIASVTRDFSSIVIWGNVCQNQTERSKENCFNFSKYIQLLYAKQNDDEPF